MIGRAISHYRVLSALGSGGMGIVYLAEDERLGRQVALKFLPPDSVKNRQALDRFRVEARAASSLSHPGICAIYDIGEDDGAPFIVMEALKGENLRDRINRGPLKVGDLVDIGIQLADALEAAHTQGIIHRDIKPSNIFVGEKNRVKILDFGLAKLAAIVPGMPGPDGRTVDASTHQTIVKQITLPGSALGTVSYMSPEQARGEDVDTRTDLFSLGAVLYEMATGTQAFGGSTPALVFDAILNHTPPVLIDLNPMVPPRLEGIISTLLEKDRDLRYQHASDLQAELKRLRRDLDSGTVIGVGASRTAANTAASPSRAPSTSRPPSASRHPSSEIASAPTPVRWWPYAIGVLGLLIVGAVGFTIWSGQRQPAAAPDTRVVAPAPPVTAPAPIEPGPAPLTPPPVAPAPAPAPLPSTATPPPRSANALRGTAPPSAPEPRPSSQARGTTAPSPTPSPTPPAAGAGTPQTSPAQAAPSPTPTPVPAPPQTPPPQAQTPPPPVTVEAPVAPPPPQSQPAPARTADAPAAVPPTPRAAAPPETPPASPVESDEAAIRRVVGIYKTAIETKSVELFRSVRPGLSSAEEARLRESFRQVDSQQVTLSIEQIRIEGRTATARLSRQDVLIGGGRRQPQATRQQTMRFEKTATGWIITAIGG